MPTKRRRITRGTTRLHLSLAHVDLALGYTRTPKEIDALEAQGQVYDKWLEFFFTEAELTAIWEQLWEQHRTELLSEWRRRGGTGLPPGCPRV